MKFVLAILVVVVQVAGPWLCCCGMPQLFARDASCCAAPVAPPKAEPDCPMCKHLQKKEGTAKSDPAHPSHDGGFPEPCPMGGKSFEALPLTVADSGHPSQNDFLADASATLTVAEWTPSASVAIDRGENLSELPFLPTEARLFAHHALRC